MDKKSKKTIEGIISISSKGNGYVKIDGEEEDLEIGFRYLNTALHGDLVLAKIHTKGNGRLKGEVIEITSRAKEGFSGILQSDNEQYFVRPDDIKMYADILILKKNLHGAKIGQKVYTKIVFWKDPSKLPEGEIIKVLGEPGKNDTEIEAIAIEKGFDSSFSKQIINEATHIEKEGIKGKDFSHRLDFRNILTFTIDPEDAKDFDDAISFREIGNNEYEVGIHIADVTHYVKEKSTIDEEARKRGTSLYLVDRTIPMLPEVLSDKLCSLVPGEDKLTMSAIFVLDRNGEVKKEWFGETIINSRKRFTYEEAEASIKNSSLPYHKELKVLNMLAKKLTKERYAKGAISLEQEEIKFILDNNGFPKEVIKKIRGDSNKLIEEFMLLANRKVAELMSFKKINGIRKTTDHGTFIYRIHENPSKEKMADLAFFLKGLGYRLPMIKGIIPSKEINKLLEDLSKGKDRIKDTVERAVVRAMAKAVYSTKNIGHYGLAFGYYAHFTSPIRRYPDMVVHRILKEFLKNKKIDKSKINFYEEISKNCSLREKMAADAERASIRYKQVEFMSRCINQKFEGVVSGVAEWGFYVEETNTKSEGLVRIKDLKDDFYIYNEKKLEFVGQKKKRRYRLGDIVQIRVKDTNLNRKTIDYELV